MEAFFSGTVIILYCIAHYAAESIFVIACFLPTLYGGIALFMLGFGGCGRMIAAKKRAYRMTRRNVISGEMRTLFYKKCIRHTTPAFRAGYSLFMEGKLSGEEVSLIGVRSLRVRKDLFCSGSVAIGVLASLSVFLTFYFIVPIGESVLRTAICAFHAAIGSVILHFVILGYTLRAEKAAYALGEKMESCILREKGENRTRPLSEPKEGVSQGKEPALTASEEGENVRRLREMLRELERASS